MSGLQRLKQLWKKLSYNHIRTTSKFFYHTCRALYLFRFKYDRVEDRLQLLPSRIWLRYLVFCLIAALVYIDYATSEPRNEELKELFDFSRVMLEDYNYRAQQYGILVVVYFGNVLTVFRLCIFLFREKHRQPLQRLVNETLWVRRQTLILTARDVCVEQRFKKFLQLKVIILLLVFLHVIFMYWEYPTYHTLYELFYCAYQTMQLTLLSLYRNLNAHVAQCLTSERSDRCKLGGHRPVQRAMKVLVRLHRVHRMFVQQFSWFPTLVYFEIIDCIMWAYIFLICGYTVKSLGSVSKRFRIAFAIVLVLFSGRSLLPIFNMLCLTMLNDELHVEAQLSSDYQTIASLRAQHLCVRHKCKDSQRAWDVYILGMKLQPVAVKIFGSTTLNREFSWDFIATTVVFGFTFALYHLSYELKVRDCYGRRDLNTFADSKNFSELQT